MIPKLALPGLVLSAVLATNAYAQVSVDVSKITCEQFAFSKIAPVRSIALWLSGYYSGKRDTTVVDMQTFEANAERIEKFCKQQSNLKMTVMQAIEQVLAKK